MEGELGGHRNGAGERRSVASVPLHLPQLPPIAAVTALTLGASPRPPVTSAARQASGSCGTLARWSRRGSPNGPAPCA